MGGVLVGIALGVGERGDEGKMGVRGGIAASKMNVNATPALAWTYAAALLMPRKTQLSLQKGCIPPSRPVRSRTNASTAHNQNRTSRLPTPPPNASPRILVLGAYGLIGAGIVRHLTQTGVKVTGLGRDANTALRVLPDLPWMFADLRRLTEPTAWQPILTETDTVVNAAGALQDGPEDDLETLHHNMVAALAIACRDANIRLIQISAVGATLDADTDFLASKARGDAAIRKVGGHFHIFRPGLVLGPTAFGGSAFLRMLASVPVIQPLALPDAQVQTVALADVARAVAAAVEGKVPDRFEADLVEPSPHRLQDVIRQLRKWLEFKPARAQITLSPLLVRVVSKVADGLAWLGWRSPLRRTAIRVLTTGVLGDPAPWNRLGHGEMSALSVTLNAKPANGEDRLSARMSLLMPFAIGSLALFWGLSGAIGLTQMTPAARVLELAGWSHGLAVAAVAFWSIVDLALAAAVVIRPTAKPACWAMIVVSVFYLAASTIVTPDLWLDPLGPLVKILPGITLALIARVLLETR
jgi:uncharacterized protein YbjT (DUF2867 family)